MDLASIALGVCFGIVVLILVLFYVAHYLLFRYIDWYRRYILYQRARNQYFDIKWKEEEKAYWKHVEENKLEREKQDQERKKKEKEEKRKKKKKEEKEIDRIYQTLLNEYK